MMRRLSDRRPRLRRWPAAEMLEPRRLLSAGVLDDAADHLGDDHGDHGERYVAPKVKPKKGKAPKLSSAAQQDLALEAAATANLSETEGNNTPGTATPISVGAANNLITGSVGTSGDLDYYSFTLSQRAGVFLDVDAKDIGLSTLDSRVIVYDSTGSVIKGENDDGDDFEQFALNDTTVTPHSDDASLYLDLTPGAYLVRVSASSVAATSTGAYQLKVRSDTNYTTTVPSFDSYYPYAFPGQTHTDTLYLDFNGHSSSTDSWATRDIDPNTAGTQANGPYTIAAFDLNGNPNEWTPGERAVIENVWRVVADDYRPFNINVSTREPSSIADGVAHRQVIGNSTGSEVGHGGSLGVAFRPSYNSGGAGNNVAFTFASNFTYVLGAGVGAAGMSGWIGAAAVEMGNTTSHEFGHALGLRHYGGNNPQLDGVMHTPDFGLSRERWKAGNTHDGESGGGLLQDDVAVISGTGNTIGYLPDDHSNSRTSASTLPIINGVMLRDGVIGQKTDVDYFTFTLSSAGTRTVQVSGLEHVANLDAELYLYNSTGGLIASADPSASIFASLTQSLAAGTYYVEVRSDGGDGEVGQYTLSVATPPSATPGTPDLLAATDSGISNSDNLTNRNNGSAARNLQFSVPNTVSGATVQIVADGVVIGSATATGTTTTVTTNGTQPLADGTRAITARQTEPGKLVSADSASLAVAIFTATPSFSPTLALVSASDTGVSNADRVTSDTTPSFSSSSRTGYYRLYYNGQLVSSSYTPDTATTTLAPLPAGVHAVAVSAVDAAGNESAVSSPLSFTVDTAAPAASTTQAPGVTSPGGTTYTFTVRYADDLAGIDAATPGVADVRVVGPGGFNQTPQTFQVDTATNGTPRSVTYGITVPGGRWDARDNGQYAINLQANEVRDVAGNAAAGGQVGSFTVDIAALTAPDLLPQSDTGASDADNLTRRNNADAANRLAFQVDNTFNGAAVSLYADGRFIGTATATGTSVTVLTSSPDPLADGVHAFTAVMTGSAETPATSVAIDTRGATADVAEITPDPRADGIGSALVQFSEAVIGFDARDVNLSRGSLLLPSEPGLVVETTDNVTFTVRDVGGLTEPAGTYRLGIQGHSFEVMDRAGNPMGNGDSDGWVNTGPDVAPTVTDVFVAGSAWSTAYRNTLQAAGDGEAAYGYRINPGQQTRTLGWANLNQVSVRFSEHVNVDGGDLVLNGVNVPAYLLAATEGFRYDPATFTATWTLDRFVPNDKVTIRLDADADTGGVTDATGNLLDGEWDGPVAPSVIALDTFPSGDGAAGGDFAFDLRVLPGDVTRDGAVNVFDQNVLRANLNRTGVGVTGGDLNGDDLVDVVDFNIYRNYLNKSAPA